MNQEQMNNVNFEKVQITFTDGQVLEYTRNEDDQLRLPDGSTDNSLLIAVSAKGDKNDNESTLLMTLRHTGGCGFMVAIASKIIGALKGNDVLGALKELDDEIESAAGDVVLRHMDSVEKEA
jgi:hypothetical protein